MNRSQYQFSWLRVFVGLTLVPLLGLVSAGCQTGPDPAEHQQLQSDLEAAKTENQQLKGRAEELEATIETLESENQDLESWLADSREELEQLRRNQEANQQDPNTTEAEQQVSELQNRLRALQEENTRLRQTAEELALLLKMFQDARQGEIERSPDPRQALGSENQARFEPVEQVVIDQSTLDPDRINNVDRYLAAYSTEDQTYYYDRRANPTTRNAVYLQIIENQEGSVTAVLVLRAMYPADQKPLIVQAVEIQSGDQAQRFVLDDVRRVTDQLDRMEEVRLPLNPRTMRTLEILLMDDRATLIFRGATSYKRHTVSRTERAALINSLYFYRELGGRF